MKKIIMLIFMIMLIITGCTDGENDVNKPTKPVFTTEPISNTVTPVPTETTEPVSITTTPSPTEEKEKTLLDIMKEKKWEEAKKLILEGWEVNVEEKSEREILTPLVIASEEGQKDIVELLIENGAEVEKESGYEALVKAIQKGNDNIVNILLENNAPVEFNGMMQPFFTSLDTENLEMAEIILEKVKDKKRYINGCLYFYAMDANIKAVEFLIKHGADVNEKYEHQLTSLHYAAYYIPDDFWDNHYNYDEGKINEEYMNKIEEDYIRIINTLVNAGAEIDAREKEWGFTPLMYAAKNGYIQRAEALIELGADVNAKSPVGGTTALNIAAMNCSVSFNKMLIEYGADVNAKTDYNRTPIYNAIAKPDLIRLFIESGADLNIKDNEGETVLMMAKRIGKDEVVEMLKKAGAKE